MEKQKGTVLKAREKQAINCSNEIFWYFYLIFHVFFLSLTTQQQPK
jgi:hypothetical protein